MSYLFIWIYSGVGGREFHEKCKVEDAVCKSLVASAIGCFFVSGIDLRHILTRNVFE
jgi:hypothetical protein